MITEKEDTYSSCVVINKIILEPGLRGVDCLDSGWIEVESTFGKNY